MQLLKKNYQASKQLIIKHNYKKLFLEQLLINSLRSNQFLNPVHRLSYFAKQNHEESRFFKFSTYQKLWCLVSLSTKVNNKSFHYSRFFLNKQLGKLMISNTFK